jgi:hypothetical protein
MGFVPTKANARFRKKLEKIRLEMDIFEKIDGTRNIIKRRRNRLLFRGKYGITYNTIAR